MTTMLNRTKVHSSSARRSTNRPASRPARVGWGEALRITVLALFSIPWVVVPLWLMVVSSFKTEGDAARLTLALPETWSAIENYTAVFVQGNYLTGLKNSLLVTVPTLFAVLLLGALAAWAYGRSQRRSFQVFYYITALSILLPPAVIPTIFLLSAIGLDGSLFGYALMTTASKLGLIVFLTTGFVRAFPPDLEEAASIDGASRTRIFFSIMVPLLRPVLFVGAVLTIIQVWNDFFFALLLLQTQANATLPMTLFAFASTSSDTLRWNLVFAHVVMSSIPLLIMYFFAQKKVLSGLTEGSLKG